MKHTCFIFLLLVVGSRFSYSQQPETPVFPLPKDLIPPSPTANELGKYGAIVLDYYSGTTQTNIPLYTIDAGSMSIPVSLSYNSSGIKVEDIASWVGLGWSLNAGGVITVNVMGLPDFQKPKANQINYKKLLQYNFPSDNYVNDVNLKVYDSQPDIFNYNFCGYSGQFVVDENLKVLSVKNSSGLIFTCDTLLKKITAIDNKGRTYIFDILEKTIRKNYVASFSVNNNQFYPFNYTDSDYDSTITAFYISKIILENSNGEINFSYLKELQKYYTRPNGSLTTSFSPSQEFCKTNYSTMYWEGGYNILYKSLITNSTWRLSEIVFNRANMHLKFFSNFNREDLCGTKALSKIVMYANDSLTSWNFNYDYLLSPFEKYEDNELGSSALHKRLALKSIVKTSLQNKSLSPLEYCFNYYGESEDELELRMPYRTSCDGYDHWGYFNSPTTQQNSSDPRMLFPQINSLTDIPRSFTFKFGDGTREIINYPSMPFFTWGGNRNPNGYYALSFSLKEIVYPTKGKTMFSYEGNTYSKVANNTYNERPGPGIRINFIKDIIGDSEQVKTYSYTGGVILQEPCYIRSLFQNINMNGSCFNEMYSNEPKTFYSGGYVISTSSLDNILSFISNPIGYMSVKEKQAENGSIVYNYTTPNDFAVDYSCRFAYKQNSINNYYIWKIDNNVSVFPFAGGFYRPIANIQMLKRKLVFNQQNELVKETEFFYSIINPDTVYSYNVYSDDKLYLIKFFPIISSKCFTDSIIEKDLYDAGKNVITKISKFSYDFSKELIKSSQINQSNGDVIINQYTYPFDYPDLTSEESQGNRTPIHATLVEMTRKNMLAYPVEELKLVNGVWKDGSLNIYSKYNQMYLPSTTYKYKLGVPRMDSYAFNGRQENPKYFYKDLCFDMFDNFGNPLQIHKDNDLNTTYIWGYGSIYPIAKIVNAQQNEVAFSGFDGSSPIYGYGGEWNCGHGVLHSDESHTGNYSLENQGSTIVSKKVFPAGKYKITLWAKNKVGFSGGAITVNGNSGEPMWPGGTIWKYNERTITLNSAQSIVLSSTDNILIDDISFYPVDSQIESYTWNPGVGMTSKTDVNGLTTYYEYDGLGRLCLVKDHEGNILKRYDYNYSNN